MQHIIKDKGIKKAHRWQQGTQRLVLLSLMTALAMVLQILETIIPNPLPWIRLGLANIIILIVLSLFGIKDGLLVTVVRVLLASILLGTFLGPTFWLSFSGGITSTLAMGIMISLFSSKFSLIGVSLVGAYTHTLTQLGVLSLLILRDITIFNLLPVLLLTAFVAGLITGTIANYIVKRIEI